MQVLGPDVLPEPSSPCKEQTSPLRQFFMAKYNKNGLDRHPGRDLSQTVGTGREASGEFTR